MFGSLPAPDQSGGSGDGDEGFGDLGELLVVANEASVFEDPGEGALNDPSAWQDLEALGASAPPDNLERDVGLVAGPCHEAAGVAAIGENAGDEGIATAR